MFTYAAVVCALVTIGTLILWRSSLIADCDRRMAIEAQKLQQQTTVANQLRNELSIAAKKDAELTRKNLAEARRIEALEQEKLQGAKTTAKLMETVRNMNAEKGKLEAKLRETVSEKESVESKLRTMQAEREESLFFKETPGVKETPTVEEKPHVEAPSSGSAAPGTWSKRECTTVKVGDNPNMYGGIKEMWLLRSDVKCPPRVDKTNWIGGFQFDDWFKVSQEGRKLIVSRGDTINSGWGECMWVAWHQIQCRQLSAITLQA